MKTTFTRMIALSLVCLGALVGTAQADEGIHAGVDLLFLSPKVSNSALYNTFHYAHADPAFDGTLSDELNFAQRVILGYEGDQGGGVQIRWFNFDNLLKYDGVNTASVIFNGDMRLDIDALDVELTQRGSFTNWDWLATAGVRYGAFSLRDDIINPPNWTDDSEWLSTVSSGSSFTGTGPTVSVLGSRPIFWEGFSIFGSGRTSLLYGDLEQFRYYEAPWHYVNHNELVQVWDVQFGVELEREYDHFDLVLRTFWEAQRWSSESDMLDVGLHGFGVHTGIEY